MMNTDGMGRYSYVGTICFFPYLDHQIILNR